mgnify:CR=1 FL=1
MADKMFDACVTMLLDLAALTGTTYREINVIIFCILWPVATVWLVVVVIQQRRKILELEKKCVAGVIR